MEDKNRRKIIDLKLNFTIAFFILNLILGALCSILFWGSWLKLIISFLLFALISTLFINVSIVIIKNLCIYYKVPLDHIPMVLKDARNFMADKGIPGYVIGFIIGIFI